MSIHPEANRGAVAWENFEVTYHDTGAPGDGRRPVVLLHGTGGSAETHFRTVYPMLAARHRVIAVDWDPAALLERSELGTLVEQVVAVLMQRCPGETVHLVGYSLGAVVAGALAARHPDAVGSLTLVAGWSTTDTQQRLRHRLWHRLAAMADDRALKEFSTLVAFSPAFLRSRAADELEALISGRSVRPGTREETLLNSTVDIGGELEMITAPTLVIACTEDIMVPARHSWLLFGGIKDARLAEIPSGHAVTTERPAQVFKLVDDFVTNPHAVDAGQSVPEMMI